MILTPEEIKQLKTNRGIKREQVILLSKELKTIKSAFCEAEARYDNATRDYEKLDREYAFALYDEKSRKLKIQKETEPYNAAKRTAAKALKALASLPEDMRKKIIANAQDGLF